MLGSEPPYLALHASGELRERATRALELLEGRCRVCPRLCKVERLADRPGLCRVGRHAVVASHFAHFGEEDCLRRLDARSRASLPRLAAAS
jgi:putative pyruvate formate lyase activating enzyme